MRKVCEFVSSCESWWWFGRILCFLSAYNRWFLSYLNWALLRGRRMLLFCVFFPQYFVLSACFCFLSWWLLSIQHLCFVNNGSSLHNELHIKCLWAINLSKNQLICKYIIASPGNQVKKKISDFPWVIDLLSPVKKMCVI